MMTEADVREALDALLYRAHGQPTETPLHRLLQVEGRIDTPETPLKRALALAEVLNTTITEAYTHHRRVNQLPVPSLDSTIDTVKTDIVADAQTQNLELLSWSWLYHRYVRVDLGISAEDFVTLCGIHPRTRRRYARHGIRRLTERLLLQERRLAS